MKKRLNNMQQNKLNTLVKKQKEVIFSSGPLSLSPTTFALLNFSVRDICEFQPSSCRLQTSECYQLAV